jgi:endonuclease/exonuclease/phosphatase family metal-dependent hydrolase
MNIALLLVSIFTFVELNCENLFDTRDDSLKLDEEFLPSSSYHWTPYRYWRKVNHIGQDILACSGKGTSMQLPDLVALTEVENDSVLFDLTRRSLLRRAGYEYVMTDGPDLRGIDVALLYSPFTFQLCSSHSLRIEPPKDMRPTRDILYVAGRLLTGDTLHILVVHAPSRSGGQVATNAYRMRVARRVCDAVDSVRACSPQARIVVAGDFNDYTTNKSIKLLLQHGLTDISASAVGTHGAKGTYRYHGEWGSLDHILCDSTTASRLLDCHISDPPFLLEEDKKYGGVKPRRTYLGPSYKGGFSDHLPLVAIFRMDSE